MADFELKVVEGPDVGREFAIAGALVIGRDPSAGLVVQDPEASRRHASVSARGGIAEIEDLGSTNGTYVNGEKLAESRILQGGDKVRIGTTVFEVHAMAQPTQMAQAIPDEPGPGATAIASVATPEELERQVKAEEAMRHAEPEGDEDHPTVVPDDEPAPAPVANVGSPTEAGPAGAGVPAPQPPPAAAPPPPAQPPAPAAPPPLSAPPGFGAPPPAPQAPFAQPPGQALGAPPLPAQQGAAPPVGYQAGPGFSVRESTTQWLLCAFVPFYAIIWYHRLQKEIGEWSEGRIHTDPTKSVLAVTLGAIILVPALISMIGTMGRVKQCQQLAGVEPRAGFGGFLLRNFLFGYGYKWVTDQTNELAVRRPVH